MNDICERLRKEIAWEKDVGELLEEAAVEIARLRLTDAEREAVELSYSRLTADTHYASVAATLRGLLERLGGER